MRVVLIGSILLVAVALAGCIDTSPGTTETVHEDFGTGLDGWAQRADVPEDPGQPGHLMSWNVTSSQQTAHQGGWSVLFQLDGNQGNGTVWIERPFQVEANQSYHVNASIWAHSAQERVDEAAHLVFYVGHQQPTGEADFPAAGEQTNASNPPPTGGLRMPLDQAEGWQEYSFEWVIPVAEEPRERAFYIAVGISAVGDTELSYHVDALNIELTRLPTDDEA